MVGDPTFFLDRRIFLTNSRQIAKTKNQCRKFKIFSFFDLRDIESHQLAAVRLCKICRLKMKFTLRDITSCFNLLNRPTHIKNWRRKFCSGYLFAIFLDIQTLEPYRVRKTDFSKLG